VLPYNAAADDHPGWMDKKKSHNSRSVMFWASPSRCLQGKKRRLPHTLPSYCPAVRVVNSRRLGRPKRDTTGTRCVATSFAKKKKKTKKQRFAYVTFRITALRDCRVRALLQERGPELSSSRFRRSPDSFFSPKEDRDRAREEMVGSGSGREGRRDVVFAVLC